MANDGADIDLYADDLEFNQESNEFNDQNLDLYDDVITPSGKNNSSNVNNSLNEDDFSTNQDSQNTQNNQFSSSNEVQTNLSSTKKIGIYVGNLTWWTTDSDIHEAINNIGITDILEVKFFENRANGQSKGFCVVSLGSESSVKNVIEKLPKSEIHSQNPVVTPCNKQNLNHFEMQSRKNNPGHANNQMNNGNPMGNNLNNGPNHMRPPFAQNPNMGGPMGGPSNSGGGHNMRPPLINRPQRPGNGGPLLSSQPRMSGPYNHSNNQSGMQNQNMWNNHQNMGPQSGNQPGNRNMRPMHGSPRLGGNPMVGMNRMPNPNNNLSRSSQPLLRAPGPPSDRGNSDWDHNVHSNVMQSGSQNPSHNPMDLHGPAPHVNPAFFGGPSQQDPYNRSSNSQAPYSQNPNDGYSRNAPLSSLGGDSGLMISDSEFEELMSKNRHVTSTAITRAVSDAAAGDFSSAIETLVTAISLIKQSKVANDERCKILISSLQDTLHGIEAKSYSRKDRPKSRERSRDRGSRREKSRRDRSRSRDYRSRSRSKERRGRDRDYHRSRDKYKN